MSEATLPVGDGLYYGTGGQVSRRLDIDSDEGHDASSQPIRQTEALTFGLSILTVSQKNLPTITRTEMLQRRQRSRCRKSGQNACSHLGVFL